MKIQTKLFFLVFLIVCTFAASLILYMNIEGNIAVSLFSAEVQDKKLAFEKDLELRGKAIEALVYDYSDSDEMVNFIATDNKDWAKHNIDTRLLFNFDANAIWIYGPDSSLLYSVTNLGYDESRERPLSKEAFATLFMQKGLCHFFIDTPRGLMEIRGATVHPSTDKERKTPAQGYFFAGRLWDKDYIKQLSELTRGTVSIVPVAQKSPSISVQPEYGVIAFSKILNGWDNRPLRRLGVWSEYTSIKDFIRISRVVFFIFSIFAAIILPLLLISVMRWVNMPLRLISNTLKTENCLYIDKMQKDKNEFGDIARLIYKFFRQKATLLKEIAERKKAEAELRVAYTDLKETKQQLIQAEKMQAVGMLASGVAHEVKNPLGIIIQGVNYLEKILPVGQEDIFKALTMIKQSITRADNIVESLLDFSRLTNLNLQPLDINSILEDSLVLVKQNLQSKQIEVVKELKQEIPKVLIDKNRMEQVFINILLNAIQAIPASGTIFIRSYDMVLEEVKNGAHGIGENRFKAKEKVVIVEIEDTGVGISEENIKKIFDPFFTTKKIGEGLGLGLSICRNIIDIHGGVIEIKSQVGKGTTVIVTLGIVPGR
jgi:signal transduction histidine kinase